MNIVSIKQVKGCITYCLESHASHNYSFNLFTDTFHNGTLTSVVKKCEPPPILTCISDTVVLCLQRHRPEYTRGSSHAHMEVVGGLSSLSQNRSSRRTATHPHHQSFGQQPSFIRVDCCVTICLCWVQSITKNAASGFLL